MYQRASFFITITLITISGLIVVAIPAMADTETGIEGVIMLSPSHPGPIRQGVRSSKPLADVEFSVQKDGGEVASFTTDAHGSFRVALKPGHYTVTAKNRAQRIGHFGPFEADVAAGKMTTVEWACDSGMR